MIDFLLAIVCSQIDTKMKYSAKKRSLFILSPRKNVYFVTNAYVSYAKVVKKIYIIDISYVLVTNIFHDGKVIIYRVSKEKRHSFFMKRQLFTCNLIINIII